MEVRVARDAGEVEAALTLREWVFCGEQGVALPAERDGLDDDAIQIVAVEDGRVVGTCRVLTDGTVGRLGRMAVARGTRRRGVGRAILAAAEHAAQRAGADQMTLHAQLYVEHLYAAAGYERRGDEFVEEGIRHVSMEKRLA